MKKISSACGFHLDEPPSYHPASSEHTDVEKQPSRWNGQSDKETLLKAAIKGDWTTAKKILERNPEYYATCAITVGGETVLHVAAAAGKNREFVKNLVQMLKKDERILELAVTKKNKSKYTAFHLAALSGAVHNVKVMYEKYRLLPTIRSGGDNTTPIHDAALKGKKKMVTFLHKITPFEELNKKERIDLLEATIRYDMYDAALYILSLDTCLATEELDRNRTFLHVLARKFLPENQEGIWRRILTSTCAVFSTRLRNTIREKSKARELLEKIWNEYLHQFPNPDDLSEKIKKTEILHYAAKEGSVEFLTIIGRSKLDILWEFNRKGQNIFHVAALHRQKEVFDLIHTFGSFKALICVQQDKDKNNILHLTAKLGTSSKERTSDANPQQTTEECSKGENDSEIPNKEVKNRMPKSLLEVSGAALRLQRELLWFREVGSIVPPSQHKIRNKDNKTPKQIFSEEHQELLKEGVKWMTNTANFCMIVAALIATMVFAAAFTVPGGNNSDTGSPIFIKQSSFTVFMISDAVAMISSIVSIIMFLSILISRFREEHFLVSLPLKLLVGLTALFVSIVGMLVAFALAFSLIFDKAWQPKLIVAFIVAPFALFLVLNFKLWFDTIKSILLVVKINIGSFLKPYFG